MEKRARLRTLNLLWLFLVVLAVSVYAQSSAKIGDINLTVWDTTDGVIAYESNLTIVYANYTDAGTVIVPANCTFNITGYVYNMTYNLTTELHEFRANFAVGENNYTVACNGTGAEYINVTDLINITNRAPNQTALVQDIIVLEDFYNASINLNDYFTDYDTVAGHTLVWNFTPADNLTIVIYNSTGILNITPDANFYGNRSINITAIDPLNATNKSTGITVQVVNRPEITLTFPEDNNNDYYANDTIIFRASVSDDFAFENCSLLIDGILNATNSSAVSHSGTETIINDTDYSRENEREIYSPNDNATKQINVSASQSVNKVKLYLAYMFIASDTGDYPVYINGINEFNISPSDFSNNDQTYEWLSYDVDNSSFAKGAMNNITIVDGSGVAFSRVYIGVDEDNVYGQSYYNEGTIEETGEYMVHLAYVSNEIVFNASNLTKGDHNWNVQCINNRSESGTADEDFNLSIKNAPSTTPTYIYCDGATCSGDYSLSINLSCGGSTDLDGDEINYTIKYNPGLYSKNIAIFNGSLYEWDIRGINDTVTLLCYPVGGSSNFLESGSFNILQGEEPSKLTADDITCNGGYCNDTTFDVDNIVIVCNSTEDPDSVFFNYSVKAKYETIEGVGWHNITDAVLIDDGNTITWDTSELFNQSGAVVQCTVTNITNLQYSDSDEISGIGIEKAGSPARPSISTETDGSMVDVTCSGSGVSTYNVFASYKIGKYKDEAWTQLGTTSGLYEWNASQIYEQDVSLKCQAVGGTYDSQPSAPSAETLSHPPSIPTEIVPSASQNFEYSIEYYCGGSNNTEMFNYTIESYYSTINGKTWRTINDSFPGIIEIESDSDAASALAYDDNVSSNLLSFVINANLSDGNYKVCIKAKGQSGDEIGLSHNCESGGISCETPVVLSLSDSYSYLCHNLSLTGQQKIFSVNNNVQGDIDTITFRALSASWNVSNLHPQSEVLVRCSGVDSQGRSGYLYSEEISIDRIPVYVGSDTYAYSAGGWLVLNLSELFEDEDIDDWNTDLDFYVSSGANNKISYNFSNSSNVTFSMISYGLETITLTADDGIVNTSKNISVGVQAPSTTRGGGGGGGGVVAPPPVVVPPPALPAPETPVQPPAPVEIEPEPEMPAPAPPSQPSGRKISTKEFAKKIVDGRFRHSRDISLSGSRTQISENIRNIDFFDLRNVRIELDFPKSIIATTDELVRIDPFSVIDRDPKIFFFFGSVSAGNEVSVKYAINKQLTQQQIDQIIVQIIPQNLTEEERLKREIELEEKIENTSKYVDLTREKPEIDVAAETTSYTINIDFKDASVLYDVTIYEEIPKCLVEIIKEELIHSDHDYEIVSEDPLIAWHFDALYKEDQIKYSIKKITDQDCANEAEAIAVAQQIILFSEKVNPWKAAIPFIILPIIIVVLTFFSKFGYKEALAVEEKKAGLLKTLEVDIEEGILFLIIAMSVSETLGILPGDVAFVKKLISWTILGFLFYKISITRILFGVRKKYVDLAILASFFMMTLKNLVAVAQAEFLEVEWAYDIYTALLKNNQAVEVTLFVIGLFILIAVSLYASLKIKVRPPSFLTILGEKYHENHSVFNWLVRFLVTHLSLIFFFVVIFNIFMEWLAIAVDAPLITAGVFFYLFVLIKHRSKHAALGWLYKVGSIGEKFYHRFIELFHYKKFILLGVSGMLVLHSIVEIGISIIPYVTGVYDKYYFGVGAGGHQPIFKIFGFIGGKGLYEQSLFAAETAGMAWHFSAILAFVYILNIAAMVFLLGLPAYLWYHMYKNRHLPVSRVPAFKVSGGAIAVFWASFTAFIIAPAFRISSTSNKGLFGVDMLTNGIASNPGLSLILALSVVVGLIAYSLINFFNLKRPLQRLMMVASLGFFFYYFVMFFRNVQSSYVYHMQIAKPLSMVLFTHLFVFLVISVVFYLGGILFLAVELWMRDELGLRILNIDRIPFFKYHDMDYVHYENTHRDYKHGDKVEFLKGYISDHLDRRHDLVRVVDNLTLHHWPMGIIEEAFLKAECGAKHTLEMKEICKRHKKKEAIRILRDYLIRQFNKNLPPDRIFSAVLKRGWMTIDIEDALKRIRFKHRRQFQKYLRGK